MAKKTKESKRLHASRAGSAFLPPALSHSARQNEFGAGRIRGQPIRDFLKLGGPTHWKRRPSQCPGNGLPEIELGRGGWEICTLTQKGAKGSLES